MKITTPRNLPHFPTTSEIQDDKIMVLSDVTSLSMNIRIIDTLNIIKDHVKNDDQFTRKTAIPQDKFLDLVNLVLTTTWYTFISQFYHNKLMVLQWEDQHLQPQQKFISRFISKLQYLRHYALQKFGKDFLMTFIPFLNVHNWKTFSITSTISIKNIKFTKKVMEN